MVKHFLKDIEDGKYDGFADVGMVTQKMENPTIKKYYHIDENSTGNLVDTIVYNASLKGMIEANDIITAIDGHKIEDDGTVAFRKHEYTSFNYFVDQHQMGETVAFDIVRDRKKIQVKVPLKNRADDLLLVKTTCYDKMPRYFIYGGYIFSPLSRNLLNSSGRNRLKLRYFASQWPTEKKKEVVVLLKVLASDISRGHYGITLWPVEKLNGETFDSFDTFYKRVQAFDGKYLVLEDKDGVKVIIDRQKAMARQQDILSKYNIEFDRSIDLREENASI
jgi:hypothetical protein